MEWGMGIVPKSSAARQFINADLSLSTARAVGHFMAAVPARLATGRVAMPVAPVPLAAASASEKSERARLTTGTALVAQNAPHPAAAAGAEQ
jgi:hypothetical protein